jgi:hypothetical protein
LVQTVHELLLLLLLLLLLGRACPYYALRVAPLAIQHGHFHLVLPLLLLLHLLLTLLELLLHAQLLLVMMHLLLLVHLLLLYRRPIETAAAEPDPGIKDGI